MPQTEQQHLNQGAWTTEEGSQSQPQEWSFPWGGGEELAYLSKQARVLVLEQDMKTQGAGGQGYAGRWQRVLRGWGPRTRLRTPRKP